MEPHEVVAIIEAQLRTATRGADGWPWAWAGGVHVSYGSLDLDVEARLGRAGHLVVEVLIDRDHSDPARARALCAEIEAAWTAAHPSAAPLVLQPLPTTRLEYAIAVVRDHYDTCAFGEPERMRRAGVAWATVGDVELARGWRPELDRVRVEMSADSSADEGAAEALGRDWLRGLVGERPELAALVVVVGASH